MSSNKDIIKKIKKIEIKSNTLANDVFSGNYNTFFKGNGMEFEDIREYYYGDNVKDIDWNVTARQNKAYIKKYIEERELSIFLIIDLSNSNSYGSKKEIISEIGAMLAFSSIKNNDKVGAMFFTEKVEKFIPSKKGRKHVFSIIENIVNFKGKNSGTNIKDALKYFYNIQKKKSIVFLISDFLDENYNNEIKMVSYKHDLILIRVLEKNARKIPKGFIYNFSDLETEEEILVDCTDKEIDLTSNKRLPSQNVINVFTDEDYVKALKLFFKKRKKIRR
ncbi:MAG: DUF58 domain-containing protein [Fusobacteria bacterium]|nr:DUF58 domain-containing protein [Fusobacteriota bacterium]